MNQGPNTRTNVNLHPNIVQKLFTKIESQVFNYL